MSLLGIDIGTSGCKASLFNEEGKLLGSVSAEYPTISPVEGVAELDSHVVWAAVKRVVAQIVSRHKDDPVRAVCAGSMGEAMVPVTKDRKILGHSILASDQRGQAYVERLLGEIDRKSLYQINPNIAGVNYSMPKLSWLRDYRPDEYKAADYYLLWADAVLFLMGGEAVTGFSLANRTLLFDLGHETWSEKLLGICGIDGQKLAPCSPSGVMIGHVSPEIAAETGLPVKALLISGGHDQCCNALGAGIAHAGKAVCGIGTYQCITPVFSKIPSSTVMMADGLNIEHHVVRGLYVSFLYNQGGSLVRWFRDTFAMADKSLAGPDTDIFSRLASEMPAAPSKLLVLPHFEQTGPPDYIADSSGVILGLKTSTQRGEILKAVMESVALYFVDCLESLRKTGIESSEFIATGGGAKSDQWMQIQADIFGVPMIRLRITEAGSLGAALLAAKALGIFTTFDEAVDQCVKKERIFEPDLPRHKIYQEKHAQFARIYPALNHLLWRGCAYEKKCL